MVVSLYTCATLFVKGHTTYSYYSFFKFISLFSPVAEVNSKAAYIGSVIPAGPRRGRPKGSYVSV